MPVFTTLEFFRSKQTISSFESMYPKSMTGLREAIQDSLDSIDNLLVEITHQYLNGHKSHEAYIRDKTISLHLLLVETSTEGLYRKMDFEMLIDKASSSNVLNEHVNKIRDISKNISDFNPNAFAEIVELFEKIIICMEKYFLSFYTGNIRMCLNNYIETPFNYENKRLDITKDIKKKLRKVFNLANQFNTQGLKMSDLGEKSNHIARITKSVEMPCFLLFPESCFLIEETKQMLLNWIEVDREYPRAIKMDINNMNDERDDLEMKRRTEYENFIKSRHIMEQLQKEFDEMLSLKTVMYTKLNKCENDHHDQLVKIKHNESLINKTMLMLSELESKAQDLGISEKIEKDINEYNYTITKTVKIMKENKIKLKRIESKILWYKRFLKNIILKKTEFDKSQNNCSKYKTKLEDLDEKIKTINEYLTHLHSICTMKSSNSTLKKIFHNLDFSHKLSALPDNERQKNLINKNEFVEAIKIISQMIDKDWITLYINLPFHPPRGTTEIENDIERFTKNQVRGLREDMALESLNSWKRFHIRANMTSLIDTLRTINRIDILKKLDWLPKSKTNESVNRIEEERLPPMSATSRFLVKHYPNLQKSRSQIT